jgi:hypothetical protein
MQRLEVSGAVRHVQYMSLGSKGLSTTNNIRTISDLGPNRIFLLM